jgi:tripartite ATP-independent transporter DctP family solute receptor
VYVATLLLGCGGSAASQSVDTAVHTIRIGMGDTPSGPAYLAAEVLKHDAEAASKGRLKVLLFPSSQLGSIAGIMDQVHDGSIQMEIANINFNSKYTPDVDIFGLPFLFPDRNLAFRALDGRLGRDVKAEVQRNGIRISGFGDYGYKNFTNNKRPIQTLSDFRGLRIMTKNNSISINSLKALGAIPIVMDASEVYTSLQQGIIDGADLPDSSNLAFKWYEVAPYVSETHHGFSVMAFFINDVYFKGLPSDLQTVLTDASVKAALFSRKSATEAELSNRSTLVTKGAKVNNVALGEIAKMRAAEQSLYEHARSLGPQAGKWLDHIANQQ